MDGIRAKLDYVLKHNMLVNKGFKLAAGTVMKAWGLITPIDEKAVLFSGHSRKYNDSPRAIYEYMISHPDYRDYKFIWALEDPEGTEIPGDCVKIKCDTPAYFKAALSSKYWITCVNIERSLKFKKKNQIYLNTGHGITIKTCGNEAVGRKDYDFSYIDYFCVSGDYEKEIYTRSFNLTPDSIIATGLPRNDDLYNVSSDEVAIIKKRLGIPANKRVILYAPTWRDSVDGGKSYSIKPPIDLKLWEKELSDKYVLLFRAHPYTNKLLGVIFNDFVLDYSDYSNINDLLKITDICISDYSATIFDFAVLEKPIICFGYDYDEYSKSRGFTLDLQAECPGGVLKTENEVINRILNMDYEQECNNTRTFKMKYIEHGGNATEKCVETVFGK